MFKTNSGGGGGGSGTSMEEKKQHNLRFDRGSTHLLVGPSASGKTFRVCNILANRAALIEGGENIKNVVFCYSVWQDIYQEMKDKGVVTKFVPKNPSVEDFTKLVAEYKDDGGSICVIDGMYASDVVFPT